MANRASGSTGGSSAANGTPVKHNTSSQESSSHTHDNVDRHIQADLRSHTTHVLSLDWIGAICSISRAHFSALVAAIGTAEWFDSKEIQDAVARFCSCTYEDERYEPFCDLANGVLRLAKGELELATYGLNDFPISDGVWIRNDPIVIARHKQHGTKGAQRKPDIVYLRSKDLEVERKDKKGSPIRTWTEFMAFCEVKEEKAAERREIVCARMQPCAQPGVIDESDESQVRPVTFVHVASAHVLLFSLLCRLSWTKSR